MGVNFSLFEIGRRALRAGQLGVTVAGQNIANVNTPGYSRQTVQLSAAPPSLANGQLVGTGVNIDGVKSLRDQFIAARLQSETAITGRLTAQRDTLTPVEATFNELDATGGINAGLQGFFGAFRSLEASPASTSLRTSVVERGKVLASAFHTTHAQVVEARTSADQDIRATVRSVNDLTEKIATLNSKILVAETVGGNIGDLQDQRDNYVRHVAELTGARATANLDGSVTLAVGDGRALVSGDQATALTIADTPPDGLATIKLDGQTAVLSDGKLRGVQEALNNIGGYLQTLDELAGTVAARVNTLHTAGTDLNGNAGTAFFVASGGTTITAATLAVSATLQNGQRVVATPSGAGAGDGTVARNIANLINDKTSVVGTQTGSFTSIYGALVSAVGETVGTIDDDLQTQAAILTQTEAQRNSVSGVSLDEEALNLLQYQKAYEAAARFLKVADEMTQTILQLGQ